MSDLLLKMPLNYEPLRKNRWLLRFPADLGIQEWWCQSAKRASQAVMEWVRLHSESVTGRQGYAAGYKRDVELEMLDPTGVVVSKWILKNTMCTAADFGDLDYSQDDLATISLTLRFDYAILCY